MIIEPEDLVKKRETNKRVLWTIFLITVISSCSETSIFDPAGVAPVVAESDMAWEDLRIQKLLPDYMILPAIEPYLPAHFVALRHPEDYFKVYWGDKDVLEAYFENGISHLKSAVISVDISLNVAQIDENRFSSEVSDSDLEFEGIKNCVINKWKWGAHPVMSMDATIDDHQVSLAWIGLNQGGQVLYAALIRPLDQPTASIEDSNMWSDFLKKTKPLEGREFYKVHGQDLREGFTLVNVYGSVLKVSAEKRIRDGKVQVNIEPADQTISCKCLAVDEMPLEWHFFEPIVKIQSEIQVRSNANVRVRQMITVLPNKVSEFSNNKDERYLNSLSCGEYGNVSIFNACEMNL